MLEQQQKKRAELTLCTIVWGGEILVHKVILPSSVFVEVGDQNLFNGATVLAQTILDVVE